MPRAFVTGIGTDVGKTYVTALFIRYLRARGVSVRAAKPLLTGYSDETTSASDCAILLGALGEPVTSETIAAISPWRYRAPLAPSGAAKLEGKRVDFEALCSFTAGFFREPSAACTLVEGIGGVMVPCDDVHTLLDLMARAAAPAVLVASTYLGALSHTLTALEVMRSREIVVAAVVVNESLESTVTLEQTTEALRPFLQRRSVPLLSIVRNPTEAERDAFGAALFASLG